MVRSLADAKSSDANVRMPLARAGYEKNVLANLLVTPSSFSLHKRYLYVVLNLSGFDVGLAKYFVEDAAIECCCLVIFLGKFLNFSQI